MSHIKRAKIIIIASGLMLAGGIGFFIGRNYDEIRNLYTSNNKLTDGLTGLWSFDGSDGSDSATIDHSGQGNNGMLINGPTLTNGKAGQALKFDGVDDYVSIPDADSLTIGAGTVFAWVKPTATTNFAAVVMKDNEYWLGFDRDTYKPRLNTGDSIGTGWQGGLVAPNAVTYNAWHHIGFTIRGTTRTLYVDGVPVASDDLGDITQNTSSTLEFGRDLYPVNFKGIIDEVRIYNRTLSAGEIKRLYDMGNMGTK